MAKPIYGHGFIDLRPDMSAASMRKFEVGLGSAFAKIGKTVGAGLVAGIATAVTATGFAVKTAASFEQAFAGVRKTLDTTGLTAQQAAAEFLRISDGLREMSTQVPVSVEELTKVAELAGQLGVSRDAILGFTRVITEIGVASDLTTEAAAVAFAQFSNIMGTPQTETRRLGDAIINLGNNLATTESMILDFGLRIAGAGKIAGFTEEQVFAIGAAMSSVGVEAEAGGTAVQKVLLGITQSVATGDKKLKTFAKTAGLSAKEFATMWEEDAAAAFQLFVEGLGEAGTDAFVILEDLGLTDQRLTRAFLSLAGAGDLLGDSFELAQDSAGALAKEADTFFGTTRNQWTIFKNTVRDVAISLGESFLPVIRDVVKTTAEWVKGNKPLIASIGKGMADGLARLVDGFRNALPTIRTFFDIIRTFFTGDLQGLHEAFSRLPSSLQPVGAALVNVMQFFRETAKWVQTLVARLINGSQAWTDITEDTGGLAAAMFILTGPMALVVRDLLPALAPLIGAVVPPLAQMADNLAPALASILAELANTVIPVLVGVIEGLTAILEEQPGIVWAAVAGFVAFKTVLMVQLAAQAIPAVIAALNAMKAAFLANPWALAAAAVAALVVLIVSNWDKIKEVVGRVWEWIKTTAGAVWNAVSGAVKKAADFIVGLFLNWTLPGLIIKHWDKIRDGLRSLGTFIRNTWNNIVRFFQSIPAAIGRIASGMWDGILNAGKRVFNAVAKLWNNTLGKINFTVPDWVPGIGGKGFRMPNLPVFHEGGLVPGPPGADVLAVLEAGELVLSRAQVASSDQPGSGPLFGELNVYNPVGEPTEESLQDPALLAVIGSYVRVMP